MTEPERIRKMREDTQAALTSIEWICQVSMAILRNTDGPE